MVKIARRFERRIPAYLEGMLSDRARRRFERRMERSPELRAEVDAYRRMLHLVRRAPVAYPDSEAIEAFLPRLYERILEEGLYPPPERDEPTEPRRALKWGREVLVGGLGGAVCGVVAAVTVVFFGIRVGLLPVPTAQPIPAQMVPVTFDLSSSTVSADEKVLLQENGLPGSFGVQPATIAPTEITPLEAGFFPEEAETVPIEGMSASAAYERFLETERPPIELYREATGLSLLAGTP